MLRSIHRRLFLTGSFAYLVLMGRVAAPQPANIVSGVRIGRGRMLVIEQDASGRIVVFDSSTYRASNPTTSADVVVVGSYCGMRVLAPIFTDGVKAVIATDGGIGKDEAGINGLTHGETIGVPVAAIAAMSAETSNGRSTLLGEVSRANAQARALGVEPGMLAYEAAALLAMAPPGRPIPTVHETEGPVVVEETPNGRIWASPGTTSISEKIPNDIVCSGSNASRVMSDGVQRMRAKGAIANDAGIARNNTAVEGVMLLAEHGIPAASVSTMSARLGEGLSTWNDGVLSVVNEVAAGLGVRVGMTAKAAARLMLQS